MLRFLLHRLALAVATLWLLSVITFLLSALAPGGPALGVLGQHADAQLIAQFNRDHGLDRPLYVQYGNWLSSALKGDLGISYKDNQPIRKTLTAKYPLTLRLGLMAGAYALLVGLPLGLLAALRPGTWVDRLTTSLSLAGVSVPAFVMLPLLVLIFSLRLRWFPVTYNDQWWHLLLPAIALGTRPSALVARMTRASFLEALGQDYVRTARAKGLGWVSTITRHAGKNAMIPILTVFGTSVGYMLGGSFVVETIFGIPGIGATSIDAIPARDYPMIQAVTLLAAAVFIGVNLLVDLLYGFIDPRLRAAESAS